MFAKSHEGISLLTVDQFSECR